MTFERVISIVVFLEDIAIPLRATVLAGLVASVAWAPAVGGDVLPGPIPAQVVRVIDGDTIEVRARIWVDQVVAVAVRLDGVDAPETYRPHCDAERTRGEAAHDFVASVVAEEVTLRDVRYGKYAGRVVARVELPDGRDLSGLLLEEGLVAPMDARPDWCEETG